MRVHLCNEVVRGLDFAGQCRFARETGYDGLEIAPFTLSPEPHRLGRAAVKELRMIADGEGVRIAGLHWLLSAPQGLSITEDDDGAAARTLDAAERLIELCAGLGGSYLINGSPQQRLLARGPADRDGLIRSIDDAVAIIEEIGAPALTTMLDCYATGATADILAALTRWVPRGVIHHIHFNDANQRGPGEGSLDFPAILDTLRRLNYAGASAVEPFVYLPDGPSCAARSIGYLRGIAAAQAG